MLFRSWMKGRKHSQETISAMSLSRIGNKSRTGLPSHWSKENPPPSLSALITASKNPSVETREKMRQAKLGKKHTPEHIAKIVAKMNGRKMPEGALAKAWATRRLNTEKKRGTQNSGEY